jgi:hypothetical protein
VAVGCAVVERRSGAPHPRSGQLAFAGWAASKLDDGTAPLTLFLFRSGTKLCRGRRRALTEDEQKGRARHRRGNYVPGLARRAQAACREGVGVDAGRRQRKQLIRVAKSIANAELD